MMGAIYLASRRSVSGLEHLIPVAVALFGVGLIAVSISRIFIVSLLLMMITGIWMMMELASSNTILQTIVDDNKRGRVMSFHTMAFMKVCPKRKAVNPPMTALIRIRTMTVKITIVKF